ncbi:hypothetical protein [Microbacterium sp.]|uniref:hypothetical protein n=1 Tax=Microbacterium sp. TaxID=51671 RepID=UPI003F98D409
MTAIFPDNTVLVNFAHLRRLDLLEGLLRGTGQWLAEVAAECERSSAYEGLDELSRVAGFMGETIYASDRERRLACQIREEISDPGDPPTKSLGEDMTLGVIAERQLNGSVFVTDDGGALEYAKADMQKFGVRVDVATTNTLLAIATVSGKILHEDGCRYVRQLVEVGRHRVTVLEYEKELQRLSGS